MKANFAVNEYRPNISPKTLETPFAIRNRFAPVRQQPLLLLSSDKTFYEQVRSAAWRTGQMLLRHSPTDGLRFLHILNPAAVLLDLDLPANSAWETADSLLHREDCPLLLLLTSRSGHPDFKTAIEAGFLIDKSADAATLLRQVNEKLGSSASTYSEQNAMQRIAIRWLKPFRGSAQEIPLRRFWGINE